MAESQTCPMCKAALVESGMVENLGLIYMCDHDDCPSHDEKYNCKGCGHPTAFVRIVNEGKEATDGRWELRCFDPLCTTD